MDIVEEFLSLTRTVSWMYMLGVFSINLACVLFIVIPSVNSWAALPRWVWAPLSLFLWFWDEGYQGATCRDMANLMWTACVWDFCTLHILEMTTCLTIRQNLRNLVDLLNHEDEKNYARAFWRWLDKQKWRKMLPVPLENLISQFVLLSLQGLQCCLILTLHDSTLPAWLAKGSSPFARPEPGTIGVSIHMASDASDWCEAWKGFEESNLHRSFQSLLIVESIGPTSIPRVSHIYRYSFDLFKEKIIGPDGVPCWNGWVYLCKLCSLHLSSGKALQEFWASMMNSEWYRQHPILSEADSCLRL